MENNENEIQNNSNAGNDNGFTQGSDPFANVNNNGYTQAPNNGYNMNGQPMGNPYGQPPQEQGGQGMAIAGMVLGIISLVCCCSGYFALVIGIVGFVLSLIVLVQKKPGKGMAIAGIICASIAVITILALLMIGRSVSTDELQRMLQEIQNAQ
jgi:hypothetical protein